MTLTKRQKEVLDFLVVFLNKHGYSPSFEEIARSLKLTSLATVHKHITTLERKGFVRRGYNQSRSIEVTQLPKRAEQVLDRHTVELRLDGRIAAGRPLEAVENMKCYLLANLRARTKILRSSEGQLDDRGSYLNGIMWSSSRPRLPIRAKLSVALVATRRTLKRFYREPGGKIACSGEFGYGSSHRPAADVEDSGTRVGVLRKSE